MEMYVQVTVQVLILLLSRTDTPTTGGLTTVFNQDFMGLDPYTALGKNFKKIEIFFESYLNTFSSINLLESLKLCASAYQADSS